MLGKVLRSVVCGGPVRSSCLFFLPQEGADALIEEIRSALGWQTPNSPALVYPGARECWIHPHAWQPFSYEHGILRAWEGDSPLPGTSRTQSGPWGTYWIQQAQNRALGNVIQVFHSECLARSSWDHKWQYMNYGESWEEGVGLP